MIEKSALRVELPETLRRRAYAVADSRGETIEDVVRNALQWYVASVEDASSTQPERISYQARTPLGQRLCEIRALIVASGLPLFDRDGLRVELAERRGERDHGKADLR